MVTVEIVTDSSEQTEELGEDIGRALRGGECIELVSDLGGGKTTLTRGIAKGLGSIDNVSSPTFTISQRYEGASLTVYHFDFYRLSEPGLITEELKEALADYQGVTLIEWGASVEEVLPEKRIAITINKDEKEAGRRILQLTIPDEYRYIWERVEL